MPTETEGYQEFYREISSQDVYSAKDGKNMRFFSKKTSFLWNVPFSNKCSWNFVDFIWSFLSILEEFYEYF